VFLQLVASGLANGAVYALVALGLVVMYKATDVVNFAQGEMVMLGALMGWTAAGPLGLPYVVALPVGLVGVAIVGFAMDRIYRPLQRAPLMVLVLATLAISNIIKGGARLAWGTETRAYPRSAMMTSIGLGSVVVTGQQVLIVAGGVLVMLLLYVFFQRSRWGKAMRAMSQNRVGAALCGVSVSRVFALTWVLSGALGAAAGMLFAPLTLIDPEFGWILIKAFAAAILGGFGSLPGAVVGGLLLGVVENVSGVLVPVVWVPALAYVFIVMVVLVRPSGLLGRHELKKI